ncbi:hypothetical protein CANINC_000827 [Pichia inconspicua]|uniref:Fatty acid hydroxylase domain-containing protein n=1 Tax=Pichia inconspicua TaxID=52247 RepID=A0A4T0X6E6_9ASCO|nr:hypothetical protein CANINC_000827 [[Candida] inconspicua]
MPLIDYSDIAKIEAPIRPHVAYFLKQNLIEGIPDGLLALIAPIVAYWVYSIIFHIIDVYQLLEAYRIHPSEEQLSLNKVTFAVVIRDVIFQHIIQSITGFVMYKIDPTPVSGYENAQLWDIRHLLPSYIPTTFIYIGYWYIFSLLKCIVAFIIIDTWQFFLHKLMHQNKYLYRKFHSRHHQLYVPYAFGALFNNPVEGFLLDTIGAGIAAIVTQLSPRESVFLFTFSTLKTVDDHCGYSLPWDLFQRIFPNNSIYHDIHHQRFGIKYNFSQPFFTFWDSLFGTTYHGIDAYREKQKEITIEKYRQFLKERKEKATAKTK